MSGVRISSELALHMQGHAMALPRPEASDKREPRTPLVERLRIRLGQVIAEARSLEGDERAAFIKAANGIIAQLAKP